MSHPPISTEELAEISDKVKSGEYYRESRSMYDAFVHDTMSERYLYVLITITSCAILLIALLAVQGIYPLQKSLPFIVAAEDLVEDVPRITSLLNDKGDDANLALMKFYLSNYITIREEYSIDKLDRNVNGVKSQSSPEVFVKFQNIINPSNPQSPIKIFQRHSIRKISVLAINIQSVDDTYEAEVLFEAKVEGKAAAKKSRWQANISFNYSGIGLDGDTGKVKPSSFLVTGYSNKILQDIQ